MPYFEITENSSLSALYGGSYDVLTVGLIALPNSECPILQCGGFNKELGEHYQWLNWGVQNNSTITILIHEDKPIKDLEINKKIFSKLSNQESKDNSNYVFNILYDSNRTLSAGVDKDTTLQLSLTWKKILNEYTLEIGCTNDNDENKFIWFNSSVSINNKIEISTRRMG